MQLYLVDDFLGRRVSFPMKESPRCPLQCLAFIGTGFSSLWRRNKLRLYNCCVDNFPQSSVPINAMHFHSHRAYFRELGCFVRIFILRASLAFYFCIECGIFDLDMRTSCCWTTARIAPACLHLMQSFLASGYFIAFYFLPENMSKC